MENEYAVDAFPKTEYDSEIAKKILTCAESYLRNAKELIYSYGSKTFLSGYELFDEQHEGRGNIDCSTFVMLVLSGISYEESPYRKGLHGTPLKKEDWGDPELIDFEKLPGKFLSIAELLGFPEIEGPKGIDLEKAERLGLTLETLAEGIKKSGVKRRSVFLAEHYLRKGACFCSAEAARSGDIVFFRSKGYYTEGFKKFTGRQEINHVGILTEDPSVMINSSGTYLKERNDEKGIAAVSCVPVYGTREVAFFARPYERRS